MPDLTREEVSYLLQQLESRDCQLTRQQSLDVCRTLLAAWDRIARLEEQEKQTIRRGITGEGEPNRYGSVSEMNADMKRKQVEELEADNARLRAALERISDPTSRPSVGDLIMIAREALERKEQGEYEALMIRQVCPTCGGTEHADPLPGTVGRRCVKCCNVERKDGRTVRSDA